MCVLSLPLSLSQRPLFPSFSSCCAASPPKPRCLKVVRVEIRLYTSVQLWFAHTAAPNRCTANKGDTITAALCCVCAVEKRSRGPSFVAIARARTRTPHARRCWCRNRAVYSIALPPSSLWVYTKHSALRPPRYVEYSALAGVDLTANLPAAHDLATICAAPRTVSHHAVR